MCAVVHSYWPSSPLPIDGGEYVKTDASLLRLTNSQPLEPSHV